MSETFGKVSIFLKTKLKQRTDHGPQSDSTRDEVVKGNAALLGSVSVHQDVENVIVESVASRVERLAQLKSTQRSSLLRVVQFENRLKQ